MDEKIIETILGTIVGIVICLILGASVELTNSLLYNAIVEFSIIKYLYTGYCVLLFFINICGIASGVVLVVGVLLLTILGYEFEEKNNTAQDLHPDHAIQDAL